MGAVIIRFHFPENSFCPTLPWLSLLASLKAGGLFLCLPQGTLSAVFDGAALATEGKMVPGNAVLVS